MSRPLSTASSTAVVPGTEAAADEVYEISDRGRIPAETVEAFDAAHQQ
nr:MULTISPECIES: Lsr2 family protein [unclassified Rhodococcus (in: high G+C Gram-positive bacteria)]